MTKRRPREALESGRREGTSTPHGTIEVLIERILPGGVGLAHSEGLTVFVRLAAPGDLVRVQIERVQGRVAFASIVELITPSKVRVEPPCPYFGRCGGCDFQQLTYAAQLAAKVEIIRDCLHRIGKLEVEGEIPITPSPDIWRYRSRAQWQLDPQESRLGYFEHGSHRVCDVASCAVLVPDLEATLEELRKKMKNGKLPEGITEFQAVAAGDGVSLSPGLAGIPTADIKLELNGFSYRFNAEGFFQINHELLEPMVSVAIGDARGDLAVDLYCGVGLFTLPLARRFKRVIGVEANASAVGYAHTNLVAARTENVELQRVRVADWLRQCRKAATKIDLLLLDPPRTGAENDAIESIIALAPRQISYVSCDPATLARDLKQLVAGNYRLESTAAFDLFPQTHHVETVVHLIHTSVDT